ncbi:MAG: VWA domain-containing protein [Planctomycetota bacterium]
MEDTKEALDALRKGRDNATEEVLETLRLDGSKEALDGMCELYPTMESTYMRIRLLSVISTYDGLEGHPALAAEFVATQVANNASNLGDPDLTEAGLVALSNCRSAGPAALRELMAKGLPAETRERALQLYIQMSPGNDTDFLRGIYVLPHMLDKGDKDEGKGKKPKKGKGKKDEAEDAGDKVLRNTTPMRRMALEAFWRQASVDDLNGYLQKEPEPSLASILLTALDEKKAPDIEEKAGRILESVTVPGELRAVAADIVAKRKGTSVIPLFVDLAKSKATTPASLNWAMANILRGFPGDEVRKELEGRLGKAKGAELEFLLDAMPMPCDDKIVKKVSKSLRSKDSQERVATARFLARVGGDKNNKDLEKAVSGEKERYVAGAMLSALSTLYSGSQEWIDQLVAMTEDAKAPALADAAKLEIMRQGRAKDFDLFVKWLSDADWSVRQSALVALEGLQHPRVLAPIIGRMDQESGRLRYEFAETLFRLTGKDFGRNVKAWQGWLEQEGDEVEVLSKGEQADALRQRVLKAQKETSRTPRFFGIEIRSQRVIFIIDVSGSMNELLKGRYVGETGEVRMERAKKELIEAIGALEDGTRFNIISFSSGVDPWSDTPLAEAEVPDREKAKEWAGALGAMGGTNLYGALRAALEEPDVDTILVLSDGEPSVGDVIDPGAIRADIAARNRERNIKIHTIALGGTLKILEWLAVDSGGRFVQIE